MYRMYQGARVKQVFSGSANLTNQACTQANALVVFNDSGADMTVTVNGITWTIKATDMPFDEFFEPFNSFSVTTTGAFRIYTRG